MWMMRHRWPARSALSAAVRSPWGPLLLVGLTLATGLGLRVRERMTRAPLEIAGEWRAHFLRARPAADSTRAPSREVVADLTLRAGRAREWPRAAWVKTFVGEARVDFRAMLDREVTAAVPSVRATGRGVAGVDLLFGEPCCRAGAVWARGELRGDSVVGTWSQDLDGADVRGTFSMVRVR